MIAEERMGTTVGWLRASFITGAVVDAIVGVLILIPSRMGEAEFRYPMGLAASLMFGWTVLLLWGYQKPVERKGLLLITIFPVIAGLMASAAYQLATGAFTIGRVLPTMLLGVALIALLGFSYFKARTLTQE
jgi:hypothetical protein